MFIEMQRHKQWVLWFILVFIGVPLAFFVPGMGDGGGPDMQAALETPVAMVGTTPVTAQQFLQEFEHESHLRSQMGQPDSAQDMVNDGSVDQILDRLINSALITSESKNYDVLPAREYLQVALRDYNIFKNENGEFDGGYYNRWVEQNTQRGISWESVYEDVAQGVNQKVYVDLITGGARVLDSDLRQQFELQNSTMRVKFVAIEPKAELTEEDYRVYYDENAEDFMSDEERVAQYVVFSLKPEEPPLVQELIEKARAGEDFTDLAQGYSVGANAQEGGDLGWIEESEETPADLLEVVALEPGQVSDSIEKDTGFHIYKVEEERIREEDGVREVRARQIIIRPTISDEEKDAIANKATGFYTTLKEAEAPDFSAIAAAQGLEVHTSPRFSSLAGTIEGIEPRDVFEFRRQVGELEEIGNFTNWFEAQRNIYVAKLTEIHEPVQQTFEEAREDVEREAIRLHKNGPEYVGALRNYIDRIDNEAESLQQASEMFPELELEIKESNTFGLNDFLFNDGIFWNAQQAFEILGRAQPGEVAGPIFDFQRIPYFLELAELNGPSPSDWKDKWETEKDALLENQLAMMRNQHQADYLQYLSEKAEGESLIQKDYQVVFDVLGLGDVDTFDPHAGHDHGPLGEGEADPEADNAIQVEAPDAEHDHDHSDPNHVH